MPSLTSGEGRRWTEADVDRVRNFADWLLAEARYERDQAVIARHMAEVKVLSRDSIIEQLSETQLAKDVTAAEVEVERLTEALEAIVEGYHRGHILGPDLILQARAALHPDKREGDQ